MNDTQRTALLGLSATLYFYSAQLKAIYDGLSKCGIAVAGGPGGIKGAIKVEEGSILDDDLSNLIALMRDVWPTAEAAMDLHKRFEIYGTEGFEDYNEA